MFQVVCEFKRDNKKYDFRNKISYLNTISVIYLRKTLIIFPYDTELQDTLWDLNDIKSLLVIRVDLQEKFQTGFQLFKSLSES